MNRQRDIFFVLSFIFLAVVAVYWLHIGGNNYIPIRDMGYLIPPCMGVIAGVYALRIYGLAGGRARTILFLTLGVGCWFIGECLWNYYEYFLHANPFPSIADIFYLTAYPLVFFGLWNEIRNAHVAWKRFHPSHMFLFSIFAVLLAVVVFYFGVYKAYDSHEMILTNLIAMGYGVGDLILILVTVFVLVLAWEYRGGKIAQVWLTIFIGMVFMLIADILFAINTDAYKTQVALVKNGLDTLWIISYALFQMGIFAVEAREKIAKGKKS
jgi:hypothetical protein